MNLAIKQTLSFKRSIKKLHLQQKQALDSAVKVIMNNPEIGELKKGDLSGVYVYKFKIDKSQVLLAYVVDDTSITLLKLATHENFYRNLKSEMN